MPLPTVEHQQGTWAALQEQTGVLQPLGNTPHQGMIFPCQRLAENCSHPSSCLQRKAETTGSAALCWDVAVKGDQLLPGQEHRARHPRKQRAGRGEGAPGGELYPE